MRLSRATSLKIKSFSFSKEYFYISGIIFSMNIITRIAQMYPICIIFSMDSKKIEESCDPSIPMYLYLSDITYIFFLRTLRSLHRGI